MVQKKEKVKAYLQEPFQKQITRAQAIQGKLLEDNQMVRVLMGAQGNELQQDSSYFPNHSRLSHTHNLGVVREFGRQMGRIEISKIGTRSGADGATNSHWRPEKPPNDSLTRPASASSGVPFGRQITRMQDVNGKLLEDIAMTRFLFGSVRALAHADSVRSVLPRRVWCVSLAEYVRRT